MTTCNQLNKDEILNKIKCRFPSFENRYEELAPYSSEIILFGSYAHNCDRYESDVDILFIGDGKGTTNPKNIVTKDYDFIWLNPRKLKSRTWLSSELALHVAHYGLWLKGEGLWCKDTFFSSAAMIRKKRIIYNKLTSLYLQKDKSALKSKFDIIEKILLNTLRLINLSRKIPNPPTLHTLEGIPLLKPLVEEIFSPQLLGELGRLYFKEILQNVSRKYDVDESFSMSHETQLQRYIPQELEVHLYEDNLLKDPIVDVLCNIYDSFRESYLPGSTLEI